MFHPNGPNFFLSWTRAWKKQTPYKSFSQTYTTAGSNKILVLNIRNVTVTVLTGSLLGQAAKNSGSEMGSEIYDCNRFNLKPVGGSLVIFTPFCSMVTGN